jgi:hypothetical protein
MQPEHDFAASADFSPIDGISLVSAPQVRYIAAPLFGASPFSDPQPIATAATLCHGRHQDAGKSDAGACHRWRQGR